MADMIVPEPGLYVDVPAATYHGTWAACSQSTLKKFDGGTPPAKVIWELENPEAPSNSMEKGTALHARVLQPEQFDDLVKLGPTATRRSGKWKDMKKARPDLCLLEAPEMEAVRMMADSLLHHPAFRELMDAGFDWQPEVAVCTDLTGEDPDTGEEYVVRAKGLLDWWLEELGWYIDLKTTADASPEAFRKSVVNYGYHIQGAFYDRLLATEGHRVERVILALVENKPPYLAAVREIDPASLSLGSQKIDKLLARYYRCASTGDWHGYSDDIEFTGVPEWALRQAV